MKSDKELLKIWRTEQDITNRNSKLTLEEQDRIIRLVTNSSEKEKINKLNFGCGNDLRKGFDNVDGQDEAQMSFDFDKFPYSKLKKDFYHYIWTRSVLEHVLYPKKVLNALWESCKNNAIIEIVVPHYNARCAYDELDHLHFFSEWAFYHFVNETTSIDKKHKFEIVEMKNDYSLFGRLIPTEWLRDKLSLIFNGVKIAIWVKLKVVKS